MVEPLDFDGPKPDFRNCVVCEMEAGHMSSSLRGLYTFSIQQSTTTHDLKPRPGLSRWPVESKGDPHHVAPGFVMCTRHVIAHVPPEVRRVWMPHHLFEELKIKQQLEEENS